MMYTYHIDVNDNIEEAETFINEPWAYLDKTEVEFLVKMLKIKRRNSILEQLDYLRDALRSPAGIGVLTYYSLVRAIVDRYFKTDFKIKEPKYYVHVLPKEAEGYLNANENALDGFYFDTKKQWEGSQTKFTKEEIEELKKMPSLKGINFDECLEEVQEDED